MQPTFTTRPDIRGTFGAVATTHWLATQTGMAVLERGGNAFDAAVAAGFVLQIVEPHLNGPGGELPAIVLRAGTDTPEVICGQGPFPASATPARLTAMGLTQMPGTGLLPAVVPGAFDGWMLLLRDYGTLTLRDVLSYAIAYAGRGFPLVPRIVATIIPAVDYFKSEWPSSGEVWLVNGKAPHPDKPFRTPAIAEMYKRILGEAEASGGDRIRQIEAARRAFYKGFVAEAIDHFYRSELMDSTGARHRGLLTGDDLAHYAAHIEPAVSIDYHGVTVHKLGPWSQGPLLLQTLRLLEGYDIAAMEPLGPEFVHTMVEALKLGFADRDAFYGDPESVDVPLETLLSQEYAQERRKLIGERASMDLRPGDLGGARMRIARVLAMAGKEKPVGPGAGEPTFAPLPPEWGDTVHLDIVDAAGNMISATPSGGWLQGSPVVPGLGFPVSTRGQICWLEEGHPSTLRPRTRPRITLSPTLVTRDGEPYLAIGTPGGDQQEQWILTVFVRLVHHRMSLQQAIDAPMFQTRHMVQSFHPRAFEAGRVILEDRFPAETRAELEKRGHLLTVEGPWALGRICAVGRWGGFLRAAATPRLMQAYAAGR
ncbi:MAG: gamma-glutamyltransferase family protein [Alphaproteobacteria bacterium]|nr:MAG: gamma-glutamyltransferase family protein [Alphaproteobacteria bacterium]